MSYYSDLGLDIGGAIDAASKIIEDPALPETACNVLRLNRAVEGKETGKPCNRRIYTALDRQRGVGLHLTLAPLRAATWAHENPVAALAIGAGVVGGLVGLGYWLGRR
jgi:hypothetical protein